MSHHLPKLVGVILLAVSSVAAAQTYPVKPIRFIVPFAPGGSVGAEIAASALADGYAIFFTTNGLSP